MSGEDTNIKNFLCTVKELYAAFNLKYFCTKVTSLSAYECCPQEFNSILHVDESDLDYARQFLYIATKKEAL